MLKSNPGKFKTPFSENVCDNRPHPKARKRIKKTFSLSEGLVEKLEVLHHFAEFGTVSGTVEAALEEFLKDHDKKIKAAYRAWEEQGG